VKLRQTLIICLLSAMALFVSASMLLAQEQSSRPEEIEWTWEVRPQHADPGLPNVLLVGDSITRNYYSEVKRLLEKVANVYLFAASTSLGDPRLNRQLTEFASMEGKQFVVVHFNNGMHGWNYSEAEYKAAFPSYMATLHSIAPKAAFIWATTTPVKKEDSPGPTNARIKARNEIVQSSIASLRVPIDDQYELMTHHADLYQDNVHFSEAGAAIQGQQVAALIKKQLAIVETSEPSRQK